LAPRLTTPAGYRGPVPTSPDRALAAGHDVGGLCALALATARLGALDAARNLLGEAEALLADPQHPGRAAADGLWALVDAWVALGDRAQADRVLGAALRRATTSVEALQVARVRLAGDVPVAAWPDLLLALELARTAADWFALAEVAADLHADDVLVRTWLLRAADLAADATRPA